jgi:hypothetical protein
VRPLNKLRPAAAAAAMAVATPAAVIESSCDSSGSNQISESVAIRPARFYSSSQLKIPTAAHAALRERGFAIVDNWLSEATVADVRASLKSSHLEFRPTGQSVTSTRADRILWLNENGKLRAPQNAPPLPSALRTAVLALKSIAWELQEALISEAPSSRSDGAVAAERERLEVPRNVMASVYEGPPLNGAVHELGDLVGYRPHRDHAPPADDDVFWCWKSDREQSERRFTAIAYFNPSGEGWEEEEGEGSSAGDLVNRNGGSLRIFVGADRRDDDGTTASEVVDVAPRGGRLVLFDSRTVLHAVTPVTEQGAQRFALSCWILSSAGPSGGGAR